MMKLKIINTNRDGLIVRQPYADQIASGEKDEEYRSRAPPKDKIGVPIYLLSEGHAIAQIEIKRWDKWADGYSWSIKVIKKFPEKLKYIHRGQQIWVKNVKILL